MSEKNNKDCHSFNVQMAKEIGLEETLILKHLYYWCYANSDNQDMIKNGYIWVYITRKKIAETYPYLSDGKIRGAIEKLKKDDYIIIDCFNQLAIDKTNWYALTDKAYNEFGTSLAKLTNGKLKSPSDSQNNQAIQSIKKEYNNKESTNVDKKKNEIQTEIFQNPDYIAFRKWMKDNCPFCNNPKNFTASVITENEFLKLKELYTGKEIADVISEIENRKDLRKKYSNLYKTTSNWLKNRNNNGNKH